MICLLLAYENIVQALSNVLSNDSALVQIGRTTRGKSSSGRGKLSGDLRVVLHAFFFLCRECWVFIRQRCLLRLARACVPVLHVSFCRTP